MFWDFITLRPETTHQVSFLFSDRGTPAGYRRMNGYGSHTFKLVNDDGEAVYCKVQSLILCRSILKLFLASTFNVYRNCNKLYIDEIVSLQNGPRNQMYGSTGSR